jgi:hypothetical protein
MSSQSSLDLVRVSAVRKPEAYLQYLNFAERRQNELAAKWIRLNTSSSTCNVTCNPCYMAPQKKYKKLINRFGAWNKSAVVYPASDVESNVFRSYMESA